MHQAYRGDRLRQYALWKPVVNQVEMWRKDYFHLRSRYPSQSLLSYRDGGRFLIIRRSLKDLKEKFPGHSLESLQKFFNDLVQKGIMLGEKDQYLSLAVREGGLRE